MAKRAYIELGLFRSGETAWEQEGRLLGAADLPLSNAGRAMVTAESTQLVGRRPAVIHHPPDEAATETARILAAGAGAKAKAVDELADPGLGLFEGLLGTEFRERYPKRVRQWEDDPLALVPPEGEPIADSRDRVFEAIARVMRKSKAGSAAVVLHAIGFGLARCWLEGRPEQDLDAVLADAQRVAWYTVTPEVVEGMRHEA